MDNVKHVAIIGGGITGMAAAYALQREALAAGMPLTYTLIESDCRLGGKIQTESVNGFTIEGGPDCFISQKPWAADLCRRLGIGDELMGTNDNRRKVFVLNRGHLTPLPDGVMLIIPTRIMPFVTSGLISWPGKLRMGMDLVLPRRPDNADESVGDFVRRRLGQEALDKIAEPLMSGIHVSDPELQSLLGTFPRFRAMEMNHRSLILGMLAGKRRRNGTHEPSKNGTGAAVAGPSSSTTEGGSASQASSSNGKVQPGPAPSSLFITLRSGLGRMVDALAGALTGEVLTSTRATDIEQRPGGGYDVHTADGRCISAEAVVMAAPSYVSAGLLAPVAPELAALLGNIRYVSTATISMGFRAAETGPINGFGYVVPRSEHRQVSACTWTSTKFDNRAPEGMVLLRCFVGGPGHEELVGRSDEQLVALARGELSEIMGIQAEPVVTRIFRWRKANPQYDVGHLDRVAKMRELSASQPGLYLCGSAFEGVGVPDCVHQGEQTAARVVKDLTRMIDR